MKFGLPLEANTRHVEARYGICQRCGESKLIGKRAILAQSIQFATGAVVRFMKIPRHSFEFAIRTDAARDRFDGIDCLRARSPKSIRAILTEVRAQFV